MRPQLIAGYRVILKANNDLLGAGFVLDYTIDTNANEIQGIDNVFPDELAPDAIKVSMSLQIYRTPDNDPVVNSIAPLGASGSNAQDEFTKSPYITVEIRDRASDQTVIFLPRAWVTRRSGSGNSEGLLTETWQIKSIGYIGPTGQSSGIFGAVKGLFGF